jgi:hypothetical protein
MNADIARDLARRVDEFLTSIDDPERTASHPVREALTRFEAKCGEYVRIAVSGTSSSGKSELVNALVEQEDLLPTGSGRSTVNAVCIRIGPAIIRPAAWVEWMTRDEAQWMLNELDATDDAGEEAQELRDAWALHPPVTARQRDEILLDEVEQAATDQFKGWQMVRRIVVELPPARSAWGATALGPVGIELVDLPGHGTISRRDELVNRSELHAIETVLFVADKPQSQASGPIIERMVTLLRETGTGRPARRVLPVLNKADLFIEGALDGKATVVAGYLDGNGRLDIADLLRELDLGDLERFQRGLCGDVSSSSSAIPTGPSLPLLTIGVDGFARSNRVSEPARQALDDLNQIGRRLPPGEDQHRLAALNAEGGVTYLRSAVASHARHNGLRALVRDRAEAAEVLARELERLPESVRELAEHPLAVHMELRETVTTLDIDAELVDKLFDRLERWVTGDVCGWPFWRTAANSVSGGLVSPAAMAAPDGTDPDATGVAPVAGSAARRGNIPTHLLKKLEQRERTVGEAERPAGIRNDSLLPRRASEMHKWFADAYDRSLLRLIADYENPAPTAELISAIEDMWARSNDLHQRLADAAGATDWNEVLDIALFAEIVADHLARTHTGDGVESRREPMLPVNESVDVLPWARTTASSPHNESYWQPQHLAVIVYERLTLIESLLAQLGAAIRASARYAALMVYNGLEAVDENPHGRLPLRTVMRAVGDLRPASAIDDGTAHSVTQLIADLLDHAEKERQRVLV